MAFTISSSTRLLTILTESDGVPGSYFEKDPSNYTVEQLKRWLKCRGLKQSGKRGELIERVSDCISSGNHKVLDSSIDAGKWIALKVIKENNEAQNNVKQATSDVPIAPSAGWNNFQSKDIPPYFNYGHIHHYALESVKTIISNPQQNEEDEDEQGLAHMTDKPLKNARKYVNSDFVHDVMDTKSDEYYFARAHVWPSMRTDLPHNVLVILSNVSGAVIHASCEPCKVAALGRCSHVVAVLLYILDHVEKHGFLATPTCTSKPCTWNKGKKRNKNPQRLSDTNYKSKVQKGDLKLIDFDPRPSIYRKVTSEHINGLVRNLQPISEEQDDLSMWEVQLQMKYNDYPPDAEISLNLREKTKILQENLTPDDIMEIPGTQGQSSCDGWFNERFWRLTASKCLAASKIGELVKKAASNASVRAYIFIKSHVWKLDKDNFQSSWMKYGIESEAKAIMKYEEQTKSKVCQTGLWVNPKYPFLGCSPDGLVDEEGLVEIKSLKIFKDHSVEDVISGKALLSKEIINRQCFRIQDGKCVLRLKHAYFYQIQMQLLVTERKFCDFILYAECGEVSIKRIYRDEGVIAEIVSNLTAFWVRVIAPELFEMRVPRGLHPFILSDDNPLDDAQTHTPDELDVASILVNEVAARASPLPISDPTSDLVIIPWGGVTSTGIRLINTCPLDNWLMIFQALVKSKQIDLTDLTDTGYIIEYVLQLIDQHQFGDAKTATLTTQPQLISNTINLYGNEDDYFIKLLRPYLYSKVTSTCSLSTCPAPTDVPTSCTVNLGLPAHLRSSMFLDSLDDWLHPAASICGRRFNGEPQAHIPCLQDVTLDDNGIPHPSWHCIGMRDYSERSLLNPPKIFIFSVDLLSRRGALTISQVPSSILLQGQKYCLYGATLWNGGHYIGMFNYKNRWVMYDGMKEAHQPNSGLSYSQAAFQEPHGYLLSYLIFCI